MDSTSDNWAGYAVTGEDHAFTSVATSWTQPGVDCSAGGTASFWAGLDGYTSDTVEQTGVDSVCENGAASYYPWWEMFPGRTQPIDEPVDAGDTFYARVTCDGHGRYTMYLRDTTKGWAQTRQATSESARDNSAEVIFEGVGPKTDAVPRFEDVTMSANTVDGESLSALDPDAIDLVRGGNTLVTTTGVGDTGDFDVRWKADR